MRISLFGAFQAAALCCLLSTVAFGQGGQFQDPLVPPNQQCEDLEGIDGNDGFDGGDEIQQLELALVEQDDCQGGGFSNERLEWELSPLDPGDINATPGSTNVVVMVARATALEGDVTINAITFGISGTALDDFDVENARLSLDDNTLLEITTPFATDDGTVEFDLAAGFGAVTVLENDSADFVLDFNIAATAIDGKTMIPSVDSVAATEGSQGLPLAGSTTTIDTHATATLTMVAANPLDTEIEVATTQTVLGATVIASGDPSSIEGLDLTAHGQLIDNVDISAVSVVRDANGNGLIDSSDQALFSGPFLSDNGTLQVVFPEPVQLATGGSSTLLAGVTLSQTAQEGRLFHFTIDSLTHTADDLVGVLPLQGTIMTVVEVEEEGEGEGGGSGSGGVGGDDDFFDLSIGGNGAGCSGTPTGNPTLALIALLALGLLAVIRRR